MASVLTTPIGETPILCRMTTHEALSQPFMFEVFVVTREPDIDRAALMGETMTVSLADPNGEPRHFHGHVTGFTRELNGHAEGTPSSVRALYKIELRPWFWLLHLTRRCRIFEKKSVTEIVKLVCAEHGFANYIEQTLSGSYRELPYCVQYNESDFDFLSRLMEHAGIYYYFQHGKSEHKLVLCDHPEAHTLDKANAALSSRPSDAGDERGYIRTFRETHRVRSSAYSLDDYDFEAPTRELKVRLRALEPYPYEKGVKFEYPGNYRSDDVGKDYVEVRLHEQNAEAANVSGTANVHFLTPGAVFTRKLESGREYLVISAATEFWIDDYDKLDALPKAAAQTVEKTPPRRRCEFRAMAKKTPFRPERRTQKPTIPGLQTAMVVGAEPGKIETDEYGRVQVCFPWFDKALPAQEKSCWIRVAQVWAGRGWGGQFVPRVGHEVVVSFLDGDPDRPLIVGSVYNAQAMAPFALPGRATTSGLKTATLDGEKSTELSFDDATQSVAMAGTTIGVTGDDAVNLKAGALTQIAMSETGGIVIKCGVAKIELSVTGNITLQTGMSMIELTPMGAIQISGKPLTLMGTPILANGIPLPGVPPAAPAVVSLLDAAKAAAL